MGIYTEKTLPRWVGILILCLAFLALYQPWHLDVRELFRLEGLYAAESSEIGGRLSVVTAHGVMIQNAFPLYPMLVNCLTEYAGLSIEFALRLLSVGMLGFSAVMVYFAAASERSYRAGLVASAMYIGSALAVEKVIDGYPTTLTAFFLLAAQLLFFQFGIRRANWSTAWILSLGMMVFGFFAGGVAALCYFVFPMFFFRRPLSVKSKFRKPGFAVGVLLISIAVASWALACWSLAHKVPVQYVWWGDTGVWEYLRDILLFPVELPLRLLPWSLIAWIPFCVALQALDETPIFSRYLRTLTFATLALLWLLPDSDPREIVYLLAPLSILTGINYELGMRRYGIKLRRVLVLGEYILLGGAVALLVMCFASFEYLSMFLSLNQSLDFCRTADYRIQALLVSALLLALALLYHFWRRTRPVWLLLLLLAVGCGIYFWAVIQPYRSQENDKRMLGRDLRSALKGEAPPVLYKGKILDLYGELYYAGVPVRKVLEFAELPPAEPVVYLLSTEFPQLPERDWRNLLPPGYTYRGHRLSLWKGVLRVNGSETGNAASN